MTLAFLSQEWLDRHVELTAGCPLRPGVSARTQFVVTGAPGGDVSYFTVVEDGRVVEAKLGTDADADLTTTRTYADAVKIFGGELDPDAAFMQGRSKVVGSMGKVLALMPFTRSAEYRAALAELAKATAD